MWVLVRNAGADIKRVKKQSEMDEQKKKINKNYQENSGKKKGTACQSKHTTSSAKYDGGSVTAVIFGNGTSTDGRTDRIKAVINRSILRAL